LLTVISIVYAPLQPVVVGITVATFFLFYKLYTYLFLYVYDQPESGDTGGLFFPKAIQHIFVGLYVQQVCLAALFFLSRNEKDKASAIPEGALAIVLIIVTIGFNLVINSSYGPLLNALPLTLAHKSYGMPQEADVREDEEVDGDADGSDGGAGAAPPAAPVKDTRFTDAKRVENGNAEDSNEDDVAPISKSGEQTVPTDFNHPASYKPQRIIWMAKDELGLSDAEIKANAAQGIEASNEHARITEKGKVDIDAGPPDDI